MESNSTLTYTSTILATLSTSAQNGIGPIVLNSESEWNESIFLEAARRAVCYPPVAPRR